MVFWRRERQQLQQLDLLRHSGRFQSIIYEIYIRQLLLTRGCRVVFLLRVLIEDVKLDLSYDCFIRFNILYRGVWYINKLCTDLLLNIIQLMVYGRILYNNIKEYTPKWYPTIPYSQTVKHTFGTQRDLFRS